MWLLCPRPAAGLDLFTVHVHPLPVRKRCTGYIAYIFTKKGSELGNAVAKEVLVPVVREFLKTDTGSLMTDVFIEKSTGFEG